MPITYGSVETKEELDQILALQKANLPDNISQEVLSTQGFVTAQHTFDILRRMNSVCPHIIARDGEKVVGYALCMHSQFANEIEILKPMFAEIDSLPEATNKYMVMGQICIDKSYRRMGIFRELYRTMRESLPEYDYIITSVDSENIRSLDAHYAVGFTDLKTFNADNRDWKLIILK